MRETKHFLTDADSSTGTIVGWTKNIPKHVFFNRKIHPKRKNSKTSRNMSKLAIRPSTIGLFNPSGRVVSGWTKNTQNSEFFEKQKKSLKTQKLKNI